MEKMEKNGTIWDKFPIVLEAANLGCSPPWDLRQP